MCRFIGLRRNQILYQMEKKKAMLFEFRKTRPQKPQIENIGEVHKVCGG
jgi:hypothetical protein